MSMKIIRYFHTKGITTSDSRKFTEEAKRAGLKILADFIFGLPGETKETAEETIKFAKENEARFGTVCSSNTDSRNRVL